MFSVRLDSIRQKFSGWKAKPLSLASGLILLKHVTSSMTLHISLVFLIPKSICKSSERPMRISCCKLTGDLSHFDDWNVLRSRGSPNQWCALIWNKFTQPTNTCFAWRFFHGKTPTSMWVQSVGIPSVSRCPLCLVQEESKIHLFFRCKFASILWHWLLDAAGLSSPPLLSANILCMRFLLAARSLIA